MKEIIKNALILFAITLVAAILLAFVSSVTEEPRQEQQIIKRNLALLSVMKDATFEEVITSDFYNYTKITALYEATRDNQKVGYVVNLSTKEGYSGEIQLVVGISTEGLITGIDIVKHSETPGLGAEATKPKFKSQFADIPAEPLTITKSAAKNDSEIAAITSATITSRAITDAVNEAVAYYNENLKEAK